MRVKTGTGIRDFELHTPRQVSCYSDSQSNNEGNRGALIELSLSGRFHLLYPTIAHLQSNVKFFFQQEAVAAGAGRRCINKASRIMVCQRETGFSDGGSGQAPSSCSSLDQSYGCSNVKTGNGNP